MPPVRMDLEAARGVESVANGAFEIIDACGIAEDLDVGRQSLEHPR